MSAYLSRDQLAPYVGRRVETRSEGTETAFGSEWKTTSWCRGILAVIGGRLMLVEPVPLQDLSRVTAIREIEPETEARDG